jgi:copper resistance protein C
MTMLTRRALTALSTAGLLAALPSLALAHAELSWADPSPGAVLDAPPDEIVVTFDAELDVDASTLSVVDADGMSVGSGGVDLEVADRNVMRAAVDIRDDGRYVVSWTAVAADGHPESGTFGFSVGAEVPDTAVPLSSAATPLGVLLLLAAILVVSRLRRTGQR